MVFHYRVCKTWYEWTRYQQFWRRIKLTCPNIGAINWFRLLEILPSSVTHIRLIAEANPRQFVSFSNDFKERCPNLKTLILHRFEFTQTYMHFHSCLPKSLQMLIVTYCEFPFKGMDMSENTPSEIEVLDLSHSRIQNPNFQIYYHFYTKYMPNLKKIHLAGCGLSNSYLKYDNIKNLSLCNLEQNDIGLSKFITERMYGIHLTKLYVCWTRTEDDDLTFIKIIINKPRYQAPFPCLEVICLRGCNVTSYGINSLIKAVPTLQSVVVGNEKLSLAKLYDYAMCNLKIVKVLNGFRYCNHNEKAD